QQIGLFPNMTIEENIVVVPKLLGWDKQKCHDRARELMSMIKLEPKQYLHRYPRELSGGDQAGRQDRDLPRWQTVANRSPGHLAGAPGRRLRQQLRRSGQHPQAPVAGESRRRGGQRTVR
nr:hypothetical protein OsI_36206 [Tanacetum cinerariifolium]